MELLPLRGSRLWALDRLGDEMAHEELKKQYEEDCKNHERPWELWEVRRTQFSLGKWKDINQKMWMEGFEYRRKEPAFQPEYFSGLNWQEAEKLVGKVVEFSDGGEYWCGPYLLKKLNEKSQVRFCAYRNNSRADYTYIRTTTETYKDAHPTITIGGVELPRPEVGAPEYNKPYFTFDCNEKHKIFNQIWCNDMYDKRWLNHGIVHLTEDRAQAWADWWEDIVVAAVRGGE